MVVRTTPVHTHPYVITVRNPTAKNREGWADEVKMGMCSDRMLRVRVHPIEETTHGNAIECLARIINTNRVYNEAI